MICFSFLFGFIQLADAFRAKKLIGIFHGIHLTFPF